MKLCSRFWVFVIVAAGCNPGRDVNIEDEQNIPVRPEVIVLNKLPDSCRPKTILIRDKPPPTSIKIPYSVENHHVIKHPLFPEVVLKPPTEVQAGYTFATKNFTTEDGLTVDVTSCAFADSKGNLWFGTHVGGLSKYDGHRFTVYTTNQGLASNTVHKIMEDREGNIWIATNEGVSKFDGIGFTTVGSFGYVNDMFQDSKSTFWFATNNGLFHYDEGEFNRSSLNKKLTDAEVFSVIEDDHKNLWFSTDSGISIYNGKNLVHLNKEIDNLYKPILSLSRDSSHGIWGVSYYGFFHLKDDVYTYYKRDNNAILNPVIFVDKGGNVWLSNENRGVLQYDGTKFTTINKTHGIASNVVTGITEDKSGTKWFGTDAGISKFEGDAVVNYTGEQGIVDKSVRSILEDDDGNLWFAGNSLGISKYYDKKFVNFTISQGLNTSEFWASEKAEQGVIWFGSTRSGLIKYDGVRFTLFDTKQGLIDNDIQFLLNDHNGTLYVATNEGLSILKDDSITNFNEKTGLVNNDVFSILRDKNGGIWFGTANGLSLFDGHSFTNYSGENGPGTSDIKSLIEDKDGNIWCGSHGEGIYRFDGVNFLQFTTENGLPDNSVTQLAFSNEGDIIVGTNHGIALLQKFSSSNDKTVTVKAQNNLSNNQLAKHQPVFKVYNTSTGYSIKDVNRGQRAIYVDRNGVLWIGTGSEQSGLVRFDYMNLKKNDDPPFLKLTAIKINNEPIVWHNLLNPKLYQDIQAKSNYEKSPIEVEEVSTFGKLLGKEKRKQMKSTFKNIRYDAITPFDPIPQNLVLPHEYNTVMFEFSTIEPSRPELVQYQFWLEGYNDGWSSPSYQTTATFGNIYEGTYTLHLRAKNPESEWSEPLIYTFKILPPWHRTWWAYTMYLLVFLLGLRIFSKLRERKLTAEKENLEKTVRQRTKELRQEKKKSDELLLNILPSEIAEELKVKGRADARDFDQVTILFTDFKEFTQASEKLSAKELVEEIHNCFEAFDKICEKYKVEKIKTIGDSYMAAGGIPIPSDDSVKNTVMAGLEMAEFIVKRKAELQADGKIPFEMRIGMNTGAVVAGIVGVKKFQYDIWGDTVNTASRMESNGEVGKLNISASTYELIKDDPMFSFEYRGKVDAKGKGEVDMYFVTHANKPLLL